MFSQKLVDRSRAILEAQYRRPLRDYSYDEVLEFQQRLKSLPWEEQGVENVLKTQPVDVQHYVWNELTRSQIDFRYWLSRYALLLTDAKRLEPLIPWPSQEKLFEALASQEEAQEGAERVKLRGILLKSRQIGGTAFSEAIVAYMVFLNPRTQGLIAADHPDTSLLLWRTLIRFYDNLPPWMRPVASAKPKATNLHLESIESDVIVGSGNQVTTLGQGQNIDVAHLSEVSTWAYPHYIDADLLPAFDSSWKHHSICLLESTGAGAKGNWFHDMFQAARRGDSQFSPIFIAWYLRPGWSLDPTGVTLTQSTIDMAQRVRQESGIELTKRQLAWYQAKRRDMESRDLLEVFYQEFPSTIEEAFQTGLKSVFSIELRAKIRDQVREPIFVADVNLKTKKLREVSLNAWKREEGEKERNRLIVWEWAKPGYIYVVGVDASYGQEGGDNAAVQILRVGNKSRPDEQVAEWAGTVSPLDLATIAEIVGKVYADKADGLPAKMAIEVNPGSPGQITQIEMMKRGYPHFYIWRRPLRQDGMFSKEVGWWTTPGTRPLLTEGGVDSLKRQDLLINSPWFIQEMSSFVNIPKASGRRHLEHAPGYHDDRIMALFIALYVAHERDVVSIADERRKAHEMRNQPPEKVVQFQMLGLSPEEAMAKWEESLG